MSKIKKAKDNKYNKVARLWGIGHPYVLLVGEKTSTATMEISMKFPQKARNRSTL